MRLLFVLSLLVVVVCAAERSFFPPGSLSREADFDQFRAAQYSDCLRGFHEHSLWPTPQPQLTGEVYRLLWLRSFHPSVCIRLNIAEDGTGTLTAKRMNVCCDCLPLPTKQVRRQVRTLTQALSQEQVHSFLTQVEAVRFWHLPSRKDAPPGVDGATWLMEGARGSQYQLIDAWSPSPSDPARILANTLLLKLAPWKLSPEEIY